MRRKLLFVTGLIAMLFILPLLMTSCPSRAEGPATIVRYPIVMSDWFVIGTRPRASQEGNAGWLEQLCYTCGVDWKSAVAGDVEHDGGCDASLYVWRRVPNARGGNLWTVPQADLDEGTHHFHGVRLFNIDRDLLLRNPPQDVSRFDGITFRYRTNVTNTEWRLLDCMFWRMFASDIESPHWNWQHGFANPDPELGWKEIIIPFYRLWQWGIPQNVSLPCNDRTRFQTNVWHNFRMDGRSPAEAGTPLWLEMVDFAFFTFE